MLKKKFFQSVQFRLVIIYILLIILAMQVIGVYFVRELESRLENNFKESIRSSMTFLNYNTREEILNDSENTSKEQALIEQSLTDFVQANDSINEVRVLDSRGKILGTSNKDNQGIVGQKSNDTLVKRALSLGNGSEDKIFIDQANKKTCLGQRFSY